MTVEELLKACASGKMPKVKASCFIKGAKSDIGQVVVIKQGTAHSGHFGCAVSFRGLAWDTWFTADQHTGMSHYMKDLTLIEE